MTRLYISLILVIFTLTSIEKSEADTADCSKVGLFSSNVWSLCHTPGVVCLLSSIVRHVSTIRISNPYLMQILIMFLDCAS